MVMLGAFCASVDIIERKRSLTILIVDDSKDEIELLKHYLGKAGYSSVISVNSVTEAVGALNDDINLILLDIVMPNIDGIKGCGMIREHSCYGDLPIIMITSQKDITTLEEAFLAGANDYITKPYNRIELIARVRAALHLKKEIDKRKEREEELEKMTERLQILAEELKGENCVLEELTVIDALTGIANRRKFDERLDTVWNMAKRDQDVVSLIMLDIDNFKGYNDNYGHQHGDVVLRDVAQAVAGSVCRASDLVARYGGEEFTIILPQTDLKGAMAIAEKIKESINNLRIKHEFSANKNFLTVSMGVSSVIASNKNSSYDLIENADVALYQGKKTGGDAIFVYEGK